MLYNTGDCRPEAWHRYPWCLFLLCTPKWGYSRNPEVALYRAVRQFRHPMFGHIFHRRKSVLMLAGIGRGVSLGYQLMMQEVSLLPATVRFESAWEDCAMPGIICPHVNNRVTDITDIYAYTHSSRTCIRWEITLLTCWWQLVSMSSDPFVAVLCSIKAMQPNETAFELFRIPITSESVGTLSEYRVLKRLEHQRRPQPAGCRGPRTTKPPWPAGVIATLGFMNHAQMRTAHWPWLYVLYSLLDLDSV